MKFLKRYSQLINESIDKEDSLVEEAFKDIQNKSFISIDKEKFEAIHYVKEDENFSENIIRTINSRLDNIKIDHETVYYKQYDPSDLIIRYNKIASEFRDSLTIKKYVDDYYTIKNEWGEFSGGYIDYYLCDDIFGIFKLLHNILFFYSENEDFVKNSLEKSSVNIYLQDILINNEIGNEYCKYNLLFCKNPVYGQLLVKKLIEEEGDIIEILKKYKLYDASNLLFLLEKGYINKEVILQFYPEQFRIVDNQLYLIFRGDLSDFDFMYEKDDRGYLEDITKEDLDDSIYDHSSYSDIDDIYSGDLTDKAVNAIKAKIEEVKKTMSEEELEEFEDYDDWEDQLKNIDALSDVKWSVVQSYNEAQRDADYDQKSKAILSPLADFLGTPNKFVRDEKDNILFKFSNEWVLIYDSVYDSKEESYVGKYKSSVGLLGYLVLKSYYIDRGTSPELLKVDVPYYGWNGDIDESNLEERIIENL